MNTLDDKTIYVFVRGDLTEEQQLVQAAHVMFSFAAAYGFATADEPFALAGEPKIVALDGGSSEKALQRTYRKLTEKKIPIRTYSDPDTLEMGMTAMVTGPLTKEQALPLANYRLRRYSPPAGASPAVGSKPSGEPILVTSGQSARTMCTAEATGMWPFNAPAAPAEHLPLKQEVGGANPSGSSNSFRDGWQE